MMIHKTIIHLLSGGMDSTVLLYDLVTKGHNVHCLLFDYGQNHSRELECADYHVARLNLLSTTLTLPKLRGSSLTGDGESVVVPFRNGVMVSHAVPIAVVAKADTITYACNKDDEANFPDCRQPFVDAMNAAVKAAGYNIEICAPYIDRPKWWIARLGTDMGVQLDKTWSCYQGGAAPCGQCPACEKRTAAMKRITQ